MDKERNKLEKGWHGISRKMTSTGEVVQWAHTVGRITHFASLTDQRHVKRAERSKHRQTIVRHTKGRVVARNMEPPKYATNRVRTRKGPESACFKYGQ